MRRHRFRPLTALFAAVALAVGLLHPVVAAPPAQAADPTPWYEVGIGSGWDEGCRNYNEVCFPLYNGQFAAEHGSPLYPGSWRTDDPLHTRERQDWIAQPAGPKGEFLLMNTSKGLCLAMESTKLLWLITTSTFMIVKECDKGNPLGVWHLIPVGSHSGQYLLQTREGRCLHRDTDRYDVYDRQDYLPAQHVYRVGLHGCQVNNPDFWWQPQSKAQAKRWGELAMAYAESTCQTDGVDNGTCAFVPDDPTFNTSPPHRQPNTCRSTDVFIGRGEQTFTVTEAQSKTSGSTNEHQATTEISAEVGQKDVWKAGVKQSYSHKWGSSLSQSSSTTIASGTKITNEPGKFTWVYTPQSAGNLTGTYTFFNGQDWKWEHKGKLDVSVEGPAGPVYVRATAWEVDYDPATFDCRVEGAVAQDDSARAFVTGYDEGSQAAPRVGDTVRVDPGRWTASGRTDGISFTYQWLRGDTPLSGATGESYTVRPADQGRQLSVRIRATHPGNMPGYATSLKTEPVLPAAPTSAAPTASSQPTGTTRPARTATPTPTPTVAPEPERTVAPEPERTVAPEPEPTVAPQPDTTAPSDPESTAAAPVDPSAGTEPTAPLPAQGESESEDAADTSVTTTVVNDLARGNRPALTVTVRSDASGVVGDIVVLRARRDAGGRLVTPPSVDAATEDEVGRVPIMGKANRAVATTTYALPDSLAPGDAELVVRFVPADPTQFRSAETTVTVKVPPAP